jgi:hypothetical protein
MNKILFLLFLSLFIPSVCFGAIHADTVWECMQDATANNVNGGGFNASNASPGIDRSQQTTAHDNGTDLAIDAADNTVVSSASHNFVAADNGNIIHITAGTGFTAGWYEIVSTASNEATLDRACGSVGSTNGTWYLGGALSLNSTLDDDFFEQCVAGNIIYMKYNASSFALGEHVAIAKDGTTTNPITLEGYNTTRGDNPTTTSRPTLAKAASTLDFGNYWIVKNLIVTTTSSDGVEVYMGTIISNCKISNTSGTANRDAVKMNAYNIIIDSEIESTNGWGIFANSVYNTILFNYIHDSDIGFYGYYDFQWILNCVFDTCATYGIYTDNEHVFIIVGNTIYNCGTGIDSSDVSDHCVIVNNIIDACTTGADWSTAERKHNYWDYNCWDNTTDTSNVTWGDNRVEGDPGMTNPGAGDFTLGSGSNCLDAGLQIGTTQGATGDYKTNIGVDQDDVTAAGGGGATGFIAIY